MTTFFRNPLGNEIRGKRWTPNPAVNRTLRDEAAQRLLL